MVATNREHPHSQARRWVPALVAWAVALTAVGCSSESDKAGSTAAAAGGTNTAICETAKKHPPKPGALFVALVVDRTASARTQLAEPPNLRDSVAQVQAQGDKEHKGAAVQTIGVTAAGQFPVISPPLSLDLKPGDTSSDAGKTRSALLGCVAPMLDTADTQPKGEGTDLIGALLAAQQQKPAQIIVLSSGLNSTPVADLRTPPADPTQLAQTVKDTAPDFSSWSIPVTWFNLGEPNPPLSAQDRDRVIAFWKALLGDKLKTDTREGGS